MKFFLLPLLVILFSCSREDMTSNNDPEISFDIDGKHYAYIGEQTGTIGSVGVIATKSPGAPGVLQPVYWFAGYRDNTNHIQIIIPTLNDTLKTIKYHVVQGLGSLNIRANNDHYLNLGTNDYFDFTITTYQNGTVNGTFVGNVSKVISVNPNVTQPATLSNGLIKNVKIRY